MAFYMLKKPTAIPQSNLVTLKIEPIAVVKAASAAQWKLTPEENVGMAVGWLDGKVLVTPTITLVRQTFPSDYRAIVEARGQGGNCPDKDFWSRLLVRGWLECNDHQRAVFAAHHEAGIWAALEHADDFRRIG